MYAHRLFALFASALTLIGCGEESSETASGSGASASSGDAATSSSSGSGGGSSSSTSGSGGAGGGETAPQSGEVLLVSSSFSLALASFQKTSDLDCTTTPVGGCVLTVCTLVSDRVSAGAITITTPTKTLHLTPDAQNYYQPATASGPLWAAGDSIQVEAVGADVPAFSGSLLGPGSVDFTTPDLSGLNTLVVDSSQDLAAIWSGGDVGEVIVTLSMEYPTNSTSLSCRFAADAGQGVVPAATLAMLPQPATGGLLAIQVEDSAVLTVGSSSISLSTSVYAQQGGSDGLIAVDLQ